jgi:hypothetical protein
MKVQFTKDAEKERIAKESARRGATWEILKTTNLVEALHTARDMGWKEDKVQVRAERVDETTQVYYVEPYEKGCGCRGILKYKYYFN